MRFEAFDFGSIRIDGVTYNHDVVIDRGKVRKRKKKPRGSSAMLSAIHRFRLRRKYLGSVAGLSSVLGLVLYRL